MPAAGKKLAASTIPTQEANRSSHEAALSTTRLTSKAVPAYRSFNH